MDGKNVLLALLVLLVVSACGGRDSNPVSGETDPDKLLGTIVLNISVAPWNPEFAKSTATLATDSVKVCVYSSSGSQVTEQNLVLQGTQWKGNIAVPAQNDLRVVVAFFGDSAVRYLGEKTGVDVSVGETETVTITMNYMGLLVNAPESAGANFPVRWNSRPLTTGYVLQQDTNSDFSTAQQVYAGSDTTFTVPMAGKIHGQTYYFRARVNTAYGYGPWYSNGNASTVARITGMIVIDVPDLPEEMGWQDVPNPPSNPKRANKD